MKARIITPGEVFAYCKTECQVQLALVDAIDSASSQDEIDYLDASHIAKIKELRKENGVRDE